MIYIGLLYFYDVKQKDHGRVLATLHRYYWCLNATVGTNEFYSRPGPVKEFCSLAAAKTDSGKLN
jgi:hypothetical protein